GHVALGYLYYWADLDYEHGLAELAIAKSGLPNDAEVFGAIAAIERRQANWSQSIIDFEKAASLDPKDAFLWAGVGANYFALRQFPAAAKALDRAVAAASAFFAVNYFRARLDIDWKGDIGPMERLVARFQERPDPDGSVTLARFQLKVLERKYDEALAVINKSARDHFLGWIHPDGWFPKSLLLAHAYQLLNEKAKAHASFEAAQRVIESAVREAPLDPSLHILLGRIHA